MSSVGRDAIISRPPRKLFPPIFFNCGGGGGGGGGEAKGFDVAALHQTQFLHLWFSFPRKEAQEKIGFFRPLTLHHQLIYRKKEEEASFSLPIWNARSSNSPFPRRRRRRWFYYSICATTKCVYFFKQPSCCAPEHGIRREEGLRTLEQTGTQFGGKEL